MCLNSTFLFSLPAAGIRRILGAAMILWFPLILSAQPNTTIEIPKPANFENRTLGAERTGNKKFTFPRRVYNNTVTRFNYHFNANQLMMDIEERAGAAKPDDYTRLLPFYPYELSETAGDPLLDSIIYKCTAGILLHDLRSDWVDRLYLLMGRAYLLQKHFDSAAVVFQYINYAFAPKDDGYDVPIGSNASNTNGVFTIATRENKSWWKKIISKPPSRNESFLWQARNHIEQENYIEAATLLELLRKDPQFPGRLQPMLYEVAAYVAYKQGIWETAARELTQSLQLNPTRPDFDRAAFLCGQMFALAKQNTEAVSWFNRAIKETHDPLLEIYSRLEVASLAASAQDNALQQNLEELLKMAKRDKYESNRDIIYYAAAQLQIKQKNWPGAIELLQKSIAASNQNDQQRDKSFLQLADLHYLRKNYGQALACYDSLRLPIPDPVDAKRVADRKPALKIIAANQEIIETEDSLQMLAGMTAEERALIVRKVWRQLRKEKGLKDLPVNDPVGISNPMGSQTLFTSAGSGEFYFLNANLRSKGLNEFKNRWGNRPNVDNWRRQSMVNRTLNRVTAVNDPQPGTVVTNAVAEDKDITPESLFKNIPLDDLKMGESNGRLLKALLNNALTFQNQLEDYPSAIEIYELILKRFPESSEAETALFHLSYCYKKIGNNSGAEIMAKRLLQEYPSGKLSQQLKQGSLPKTKDPATLRYENIYNLFIEGEFDRAKEEKLKADKELGNSYWTPQLLYIEAIYYTKVKQDSVAIQRLKDISRLFPGSPLAEKAATMAEVLSRRKEIEAYLSNLSVDRGIEDLQVGADVDKMSPIKAITSQVIRPAAPTAPLSGNQLELKSSIDNRLINTGKETNLPSPAAPVKAPISSQPIQLGTGATGGGFQGKSYRFHPNDTAYLVLVLNKVDPIFVNESRNAFLRYNQMLSLKRPLAIQVSKLNDPINLLLFGPFTNADEAIAYMDRVRPMTASRILPWIPANKFSYSLISPANLALLMESKDLDGYNGFLKELFPDKF
ncbi:MAG: tetratricopeptide repeat protein [Sediminibacterium sp.]